jgi:DNA-directed RNA polymerase specialized sigma24 family protein
MHMSEASDRLEQEVLVHLELLCSVARELTRDCATAQHLTEHTISRVLGAQVMTQADQSIKAHLLTTLRHTYIEHYRDSKEEVVLIESRREDAAKQVVSSLGAENLTLLALGA